MIVREVVLKGVTKHADTRLVLPARGLVVVTGDNGSGKSSIIEAVALAAYGRTLRGAPVWGAEKASVRLVTDKLEVERSRSGTRGTLRWNHTGASPVAWESSTRAQEALERELPPWEAWRRGCVFSSSDAAHFSTASDADRKRLLEAALGVDVFDGAAEAVRKDLRVAQMGAASARGEIEQVRLRLAGARDRAEQSRRSLAGFGLDPDALASADRLGGSPAVYDMVQAALPVPPPPEEMAAEVKKLQEVLSSIDNDLRAAERTLDELSNVGGAARANAAHAAKVARGLRAGACPTCFQDVTGGHLRALAEDARAKEDAAAEEERSVAEEREAALAAFEELAGDRSLLVKRIAEGRARLRVEGEARDAQERLRSSAHAAWRILEAALKEVGVLAQQLAAAEEYAETYARNELLTEAAEHALGLRGVRAHVLRRGLAALNAVASAWLPRLGRPDLTVEVRPYAERKSGGVVDAVDVVVGGAGAGHGYRGASAGERRRIDVALLLGVAELAGAASRSESSSLFFDELFDGLDASGRAACAGALAELAADRTVVVITHDEDLAARLPAVRRVRVVDGCVS